MYVSSSLIALGVSTCFLYSLDCGCLLVVDVVVSGLLQPERRLWIQFYGHNFVYGMVQNAARIAWTVHLGLRALASLKWKEK